MRPGENAARRERRHARKSTMKFTGLILICAASTLALVLPAIGVVRFPMAVNSTKSDPAITVPVSKAGTSSLQVLAGMQSPSMNSLPPNSSSNSSFSGDFLPGNPPPSGGLLSHLQMPSNETTGETAAGEEPTPASGSNLLGMGAWLLLGPVGLLGLILWVISPEPKARPRGD